MTYSPGARSRLRHEPIEKRIRASADGATVLDSTRAVLVWEPRRVVPTYAVPAEDIQGELAAAPAVQRHAPTACCTRGSRSACTRPRASRSRSPIARAPASGSPTRTSPATSCSTSPRSTSGTRRTSGRRPPARSRIHRVDVRQTRGRSASRSAATSWPRPRARGWCSRRSSRRASTSRARTSRSSSIRATAQHATAPTRAGRPIGRSTPAARRPDIAWSYEQPLPDAPQVTGLVAFWDERVDVFLDGERRARPGGAIAAALRDEFVV